MYEKQPRRYSSIILVMILLGLGVYHVYAVGQLREDVKKADEDIGNLKQVQIDYSAQNKALSEELEELESTHLQELEKIETYEEKVGNLEEDILNKESEIDKLNEDLQAKRESEEEEARLAEESKKESEEEETQLAMANNSSDNDSDKSTVLSSNNTSNSEQNEVTTLSSPSNANNTSLGTFDVTYYSAYDGTQIGVTRGGTNMANGNIHTSDGYRVIASDLSVIPLGTIVRVTTGNGESFLAKVDDSGGAIVGNKIDIAVSSPEEALSLGRGTATVEIVN